MRLPSTTQDFFWQSLFIMTKVALGNGHWARERATTYLLHSDLNVAVHFLPMEILWPARKSRDLLSKAPLSFPPFPKGLTLRVEAETVSAFHCPPWQPTAWRLGIERWRREEWMGREETRPPVPHFAASKRKPCSQLLWMIWRTQWDMENINSSVLIWCYFIKLYICSTSRTYWSVRSCLYHVSKYQPLILSSTHPAFHDSIPQS